MNNRSARDQSELKLIDMPVAFLYKESMQWLNQVQVIRNCMSDIKRELDRIYPKKTSGNLHITADGLLQKANALLTKDGGDLFYNDADGLVHSLNMLSAEITFTEESILASLNHEKTFWAGRNHDYKTPVITNEFVLFDYMRNIFCNFIDLERKVTQFLTEQADGCDCQA